MKNLKDNLSEKIETTFSKKSSLSIEEYTNSLEELVYSLWEYQQKLEIQAEELKFENGDHCANLDSSIADLESSFKKELILSKTWNCKAALRNCLYQLSDFTNSDFLGVIDCSQSYARWVSEFKNHQTIVAPKFLCAEIEEISKEGCKKKHLIADNTNLTSVFIQFKKQFPNVSSIHLIEITTKAFIVATCSSPSQNDKLLLIDQTISPLSTIIEVGRIQEERAQEAEMFQTIAKSTSDGIAVRKGETFSFISQVYLDILGYTEEEERNFDDKDIYNLIHPLDREATFSQIQGSIEKQSKSYSSRYRIKHKNGHFVWRKDRITFKYNSDGSLRESYIVARDITEQVEGRKKLHQKERQAKALLDALPDLVFRLDSDGYYKYFKADSNELFVDQSNIVGSHFRDLLPKEVADKVENGIKRLHNSDQIQLIEYSLDMPGGKKNHYEARLILSGKNEVTCIVRNITEQVEREQTLRTLEAAVEQSPVTVMLTDSEGIITYINKKFCEVTGYSKTEVIGKKPNLLKSGHTSDEEYKHIWQSVLRGESWTGEFLNKKKNGDTYWESAVISPVFNSEGEIYRLLAIKEDISTLKRLNSELERLSLVASKSQDAIIITDKNIKIEWVNDSFTKLTGYTFNEVEGKIPGHFLQGVETKEEHIKAMRSGISSMASFSQVILNYHKNGTPYWVDCKITPVLNHDGELEKFIAVERDITELINAEAHILQERNLLKTVIDHLPSIVFMKDLQSKRILVNSADVLFQGASSESEIIGKSDFDLYSKDVAQQFRDQDLKIINSKKPLINKEVAVTIDDKKHWFLLSKIPMLNDKQEVESIIGIAKEITELKNREFELEEAISIMTAQNKRLKNFAYIISHNIRSHAANIDSLIDLILNEEDNDSKMQFEKLLKDVSKKQLSTLDDLNDAIRIKEDTSIEFTDEDVELIIDEILSVLRPEIQKYEICITKEISMNSPISTHRPYFESIVLNLISNAIKYRDKRKKSPLIKISCSMSKGIVSFQVEDNGLGIDVERYTDRLFGMNQTFHKHPQAHGIGLFLVKNQVDALGGEIKVVSTPKKGSTFTVLLPNYT